MVIWHVLAKQVADKHADENRVAVKFMRWSWALTEEQRDGLSTRLFVRRQLMRLQIGGDLTHFTYGGMPRRIPRSMSCWLPARSRWLQTDVAPSGDCL